MNDELKEEVASMIKCAGGSENSNDALKFSQAACNAAKALSLLQETQLREKKES